MCHFYRPVRPSLFTRAAIWYNSLLLNKFFLSRGKWTYTAIYIIYLLQQVYNKLLFQYMFKDDKGSLFIGETNINLFVQLSRGKVAR